MELDGLLNCVPSSGVDFVRGENAFLWTAEGRRYVDLESGSWSTLLGHGHSRINAAIRAQVDRVIHLNVRHPNHLAVLAAQRLARATGHEDGRSVFLSSGSEAMEFAIEAARGLTGRPLLVGLKGSYLGAYGSAGRQPQDQWVHVDRRVGVEEALASIPFDRVAAFVLEPGGGSPDFVHLPPAPLVLELVRRVREAGGLVVVNEVTTGMGRTGTWFGYQHYGIVPQIVAVGKGLGNGYPVSAVVLDRASADRWEAAGLRWAQSHQNNPLGCAVAAEVLAETEEGAWVDRGWHLGARVLEALRGLADPSGLVKEVRGRGMLLAVELETDRGGDGEAARRFLWNRGLIAAAYPVGYPAGTGLRFDPALTIGEDSLDLLVSTLGDYLADPFTSSGRIG